MTFRTKQRVDYWVGGALLALLFPCVRLLAILLRRDHSLTTRRGCVVIKMVGAGSLFLAMPAMQAVRRQFPPGSFFLVGTPAVTGFADSHRWFDECWTIDDSNVFRLLVTSLRVIWLIARHTDHLIDLEVHSRLTTALGILAMTRNRLGFFNQLVNWRRGFYTHMTYFNVQGPVFAYYDLLARWFNVDCVDVLGFHAQFRASVMAQPLRQGVVRPESYLVVGHGSSDLARERQLTPAEWVRILGPEVRRRSIVLLGARSDAALADAIIQGLGSGQNLCGQVSLKEAARIIASAEAFYGIDSLLLHLARALSVPSTSFWGPTDPATRLRRPAAQEKIVFIGMTCSPCVHVHDVPPCLGRRDCMAAAVEEFATGTSVANSAHCSTGWAVGPQDDKVVLVSINNA